MNSGFENILAASKLGNIDSIIDIDTPACNAREETPPLLDLDDFSLPENFSLPDNFSLPPEDVASGAGVGASADAGGCGEGKRTASRAGLATVTATSRAGRRRKAAVPKSAAAKKPPSSLIRRRTRNRAHVKRSRLRKKFLLESLEEQVRGLQGDLFALKSIIRRELPHSAVSLLKDTGDGPDERSAGGPGRSVYAPCLPMQSVTITDPSLPDNPIVYASQGFLNLTGYTLDEVMGRNFRFLQGPDTDQVTVDVMRRGFKEGTDMSVCLLNYKKDGTPFWNQFFVSSLKDREDNVVNFLGVHCEVSKFVVE